MGIAPDDTFYVDMSKATTLARQATAYAALVTRSKTPPPPPPPPVTPDVTSPTVPTILSVQPVSPTSLIVSWAPSQDAVGVTGYRISRGGGFKVFTPTGTATTYIDNTLAAGSYYWYTVAACDAAGNWSPESAAMGGTTLTDPGTPPPPPPPTTGTLPFGLSANAADYGPKAGLPARTSRGALVVTTAGAVIENVDCTSIVIAADNVTIRNATVRGASRDGALVEWGTSRSLTLEDIAVDGTLNGAPGACQAFHGWGGNTTVRRCSAVGVANGVEFGGSGLVEWCRITGIAQVPGTDQHPDGIQTDGGGPYTIRNNYVDVTNPRLGSWQTSAIGMWADLANLHDTLVEHNVVGPVDGFLFYCGTLGGGFSTSNVQFNNNVILRRPQGSEYGVWYGGSAPSTGTHSGNVFADGSSAD